MAEAGYECEGCQRTWPARSAAETCAEQDLIEEHLARRPERRATRPVSYWDDED